MQINVGLLSVILLLGFCNPKAWNPITISIGLLVIPFAVKMVFVSTRKYCVGETGLIISYPLGITSVFRWDEISEVALCKVHYAAGCDAHKVAIRCSIGSEDSGPSKAKFARESWQSVTYEVFHYKSIVSIYFTPERLAEFENFYPHHIKDYRHLKERA